MQARVQRLGRELSGEALGGTLGFLLAAAGGEQEQPGVIAVTPRNRDRPTAARAAVFGRRRLE